MTEQATVERSELLALMAEIVAAQVSNNATAAEEVPAPIKAVFDKLHALANDDPERAELVPAVPIRRTVTDDYIVFVRRTAVQTAVRVITTGVLMALLTGIAMKLRWFGPNP